MLPENTSLFPWTDFMLPEKASLVLQREFMLPEKASLVPFKREFMLPVKASLLVPGREFIVSRRKKLVLKMEIGDCDNISLPDFMACGRLALPDFCGLCTCTIFQIQNGCKQSKNSSKMWIKIVYF